MDDTYELARFDWGKESFDVFAPSESGVYLIFDWGEKLIYVGEAVNINRRLTEHLTSKELASVCIRNSVPGEFAFIEVPGPKKNRLAVEEHYRILHLPPCNSR